MIRRPNTSGGINAQPYLIAGLLVATVALAAAHQLATRANATGIPATQPLFYGGTVAKDGRPIEGTRTITVNVWGTTDGGEPLCTTDRRQVEIQRGHFRVEMPDDCASVILEHGDVWTEVVFEGESLGRMKTGAVPYAAQAARARIADVATRARASREGFEIPGAVSVDGDVAARSSTLGETEARWLQVNDGVLDVTEERLRASAASVSAGGLSPNSSDIQTITNSGSVQVTANPPGQPITIRAEVQAQGLDVQGNALFNVAPDLGPGLKAEQSCETSTVLLGNSVTFSCTNSLVKGFGLNTSGTQLFVTCSASTNCP